MAANDRTMNTSDPHVTENHVGKKYIDDTGMDSIESDPKTTVRHSEIPENSRIIRGDSIVTMDFNPDRLNLYLDKDDKVEKQTYG